MDHSLKTSDGALPKIIVLSVVSFGVIVSLFYYFLRNLKVPRLYDETW